MKKTVLLMLSVLMSLTASAYYFTVNGIGYEHLGGYDPHVKVVGMADGVTCPKRLTIPSMVTDSYGDTYKVVNIRYDAFWECSNLESIYINDNVETVDGDAFTDCTGLKYIRFPETLNVIFAPGSSMSRGAFEGCTALESIYLPASMSKLSYATAPNNICRWAFKDCTGLKTVIIAATNPVIEDEAFINCTSLQYLVSNVTAPKNLSSNTFQGIPSTATLIVPNGTRAAYQAASGWNRFSNIVERSNSTKVFAIATAGQGGKIGYGGKEVQTGTSVWDITKGQSVTVTITPDEGHHLLRLLKDGQDVTAQVSGGKYTVQNVQQDFRLEAVFEEGTTPGPQPGGGTATLSIEPFTIKAGETQTMLIDMNNPGDEITAVEFYLQLPEGLSIVMEDGEPAVDIAVRTTWRKHTLTVNTTDGHFLLYSSTNATLSGTSGAIISVKLQASSSFNGGDIRLTGQILNTPVPVVSTPPDYVYTIEGTAPEVPKFEMLLAAMNAVNGVVYENNVKMNIYLTNISDERAKFTTIVTYQRLENGTWGEKKIGGLNGVGSTFNPGFKESYGYTDHLADGYYRYEYGYKSETGTEFILGHLEFEVKADDNYSTIVMNEQGMMTYSDAHDLDFSNVSGLKAYTAGSFNTQTGEALMMRILDAPAETGMLIVGEEGAHLVPRKPSATIYVNLLKAVIAGTRIESAAGEYTNYLFSSGKFERLPMSSWYIGDNSAYLQIPTSAAGSRQTVTLRFDDTDGISGVEVAEGQPFDVYSLCGVLVKQNVTSMQQLPSGIYIVNGRKVVVR